MAKSTVVFNNGTTGRRRYEGDEKIIVRIAIPLFGERVSPHFGASSRLLFLEVRGRTIRREEIWDAGRERGPMEIARLLAASGVDKVICGGIQTEHKQWLIHRGIRVVDNQIGPFREIVAKLLGCAMPIESERQTEGR